MKEQGLRLTLVEREEIALGINTGESRRGIARRMGRSASTVSRELRKVNGGGKEYRACAAEQLARELKRRPKPRLLDTNLAVRDAVTAGLKKCWSPAQISAKLAKDNPEDLEMRVSNETIYNWFYLLPKGEFKAELMSGMRRGRRARVPHARIPETRGQIPCMVSIDERPKEVAERKIPGHWEGDLIIGKRSASAVATLVERKTRFVLLVPLPHGRGAEAVRVGVQKTLTELPKELVNSLTWDQGKEMSQHQQFTVDTGIQVYFAHPHSPWERGCNENTNGLLRQYMPKGTVLPASQEALNLIARSLNGRPRRTLDWKTPAEAFAELTSTGVAMTA